MSLRLCSEDKVEVIVRDNKLLACPVTLAAEYIYGSLKEKNNQENYGT